MGGPVVTISRQHGSGGEEVAALVAERLGVPLLDDVIRQRAAERSGISERTIEDAERPASFMTRMLERLGSVGIMADGGAVETAHPLTLPTSDTFREAMAEVVREAADEGAVIIGHAAHVTLRDTPGVLRVFVQAPIDARIARVAREQGMTAAEARRQIEKRDRDRVRFYNDTYHVNWYDSRLYDCIVDTYLLGVDGAADVVVDLAERICRATPSPAEPGPVAAMPAVPAPPATEIDQEGEVVHVRGEDVHIRPMTAGDAPALLGLFRTLPLEDLLFLRRDVNDPLVVDAWERDVVDGKMLTLLAETIPTDGRQPEVIGEASLRRSEVPWTSHVGEVRAIVAPAHRTRGLGRTLLHEVLKAAQDAGIDKVTAETMAEQEGTQRLLKGLGFVEEGRFHGYARDLNGKTHDLVVMTYTRTTTSGAGGASV